MTLNHARCYAVNAAAVLLTGATLVGGLVYKHKHFLPDPACRPEAVALAETLRREENVTGRWDRVHFLDSGGPYRVVRYERTVSSDGMRMIAAYEDRSPIGKIDPNDKISVRVEEPRCITTEGTKRTSDRIELSAVEEENKVTIRMKAPETVQTRHTWTKWYVDQGLDGYDRLTLYDAAAERNCDGNVQEMGYDPSDYARSGLDRNLTQLITDASEALKRGRVPRHLSKVQQEAGSK